MDSPSLLNKATSYADDISDGQGITICLKLLLRWKGSLYKLLWIDLALYMGLYYAVNLLYRFILTDDRKRSFEEMVKFCDSMQANIPISFLLGFFVAGVIARWWQMYLTIPWLNRMSFLADGMIVGNGEEKSRKLRLTLLRYLNLSWILLMRNISDQIKNRFQENTEESENSLRDTFFNFNRDRKIQTTYRKIITDAEIRAFENIAAENYAKNKKQYTPEYWVPLQWCNRLLHKAFLHSYISDPRTLNNLIDEVEIVRSQMHTMQIYSGIMIPLVYTQVVIIAVYTFFVCQLLGSQFVDPAQKITGHEVDFYVPVFTMFQFLFLMGWLKVAMCVMNPFGKDDEDFQTSDILDYNLDVSYRTACGHKSMYPDTLERAPFTFQKQSGQEQDHLEGFMEDIDGDLEEIDPPNLEEDVTALELRRTKTQKLKSILCCNCQTTFRHSLYSNHTVPVRSSRTTGHNANRFMSQIEDADDLTRQMVILPMDSNDLSYNKGSSSEE